MCNRLEQSCLTLEQEQVALFFLLLETLSYPVLLDNPPGDYAWLSGHILLWWDCCRGIKWLQSLWQIVHSHLSPAAFELSH